MSANAHQGGQLRVNLGVVVVAVEGVGARALCQHRNRQAGMAVRGEGHAGFVVDDVGDGNAQRLVGAVKYRLLLIVRTGGSAVDAFS